MSWNRDEMAARAAKELQDGEYVNLGIGLPTLIPDYLPEGFSVLAGRQKLVNDGMQTVSVVAGASYFDSATSFAMIRGGHVDVAVLGGMQVAANGDLANWMVPGSMVKGMGGAMDLVNGAERVIVLMDHVAKSGAAKLVSSCDLPLTGKAVVSRVITDLGVFDVTGVGFRVVELAPGVDYDDVVAKTGALLSDGRVAQPAAVGSNGGQMPAASVASSKCHSSLA